MMDLQGLNIVIAGGGTGGHLFPGVAIADAFKEISSQNEILFLNTGNKIEKKILDKQGYDYKIIPSGGILGKNLLSKFKSIIKIFKSLSLASKKLDEFEADAVIGVGGYVSVPVIISAWIKGIPVFIQEQNTIPGITNKIFSYISILNFISFENTKIGPVKKRVFTGNPIRKKIASQKSDKKEHDELTILITGGSQGAKAINNGVVEALEYINQKDKIKFIHQTGDIDFDPIQKEYEKNNIKVNLSNFFQDMDEIYKETDIVIARSGATTVSEISCAGIPAILIPFPHATHNHQYHNSMSLVEKGAAFLIEEKDLNGKALAELINDLLEKPEKLVDMSRSMAENAKPNAAYDICSYIIGKLN